MRRAVGVFGELLVTLGLLVLLFVVWQVWWTDVESDRAQTATVSSLSREFSSPSPSTAPVAGAAASDLPAGAFAIVRIPRFGADYARPLVEGTSAKELAEGLGHYSGTAGPGEVGNFAIAGHRTTYGKPLAQIDTLRAGDRIVVETAAGWTVYAVSGHEIVRPWQGEVIAPVPGRPGATPTKAVLTLTSCHPKFSAKQRWIVHADLVEERPRAQGPPSEAVSTQGGS
ncbi:class E sortase [Knoellia sp. Soil729]|uniref:class E sortase n=1 Tax=Knoellia sp. Soil729 TaxID=1736394 RepID=UPI0007001874|nr:class E sortase [Knoellia sp. Soil729]KRE42817.1 sortase [Knoellia sp. Soil729]